MFSHVIFKIHFWSNILCQLFPAYVNCILIVYTRSVGSSKKIPWKIVKKIWKSLSKFQSHFHETRTRNSKISTTKYLQQPKQSLENKTGGIMLMISNYASNLSIWKSMVLSQNRHRDQWIRIDSLEIYPNIHEQLISDNEPRIYNRDNENLLNRWCWRKLNNNMQKNETGPLFYTKHKS